MKNIFVESNTVLSMDDFISALEKSPRNWTLDQHGRIGVKGRFGMGICPRTWVGQNVEGELGFSSEVIYWAADNSPNQDPVLRDRLLKACGLA